MGLKTRPVPKPFGKTSDTKKLMQELKKANQEVVTYRRLFINAKQKQEQLLARLLEDIELDPALLELEQVQI